MKPNTIEEIVSRLVHQEDGCWVWPMCKIKGYGSVRFEGRSRPVHRLVYEHFKGPIPEGLTIDHLCRNKACSNPEHLEAVTAGVNVLRGDTITARNSRKTNCPLGHGYEVLPSGRRICRVCMRRIGLRSYYRRRSRLLAHEERCQINRDSAKRRKPRDVCGENNPRVKLTKLQVLEIRKQRLEGVSHNALALKFGVCRQQISAILKGESWKEVGGDGDDWI